MLEKSSNLQGLFEHFDKSLVILTLQRMTFQRADWLSGRAIFSTLLLQFCPHLQPFGRFI